MLKILKNYFTTRKCSVCYKRKPVNEINHFPMSMYDQVCEDCIEGGKWQDANE